MRRLWLIAVIAALATPVHAAVLTVTNTDDEGPGCLRECVSLALPGDEIQFDSALDGQPIVLASGPLVIEKDLVIQGRGPENTILSGNHRHRVIVVQNAGDTTTTASLTSLTLAEGRTSSRRPPCEWGAGLANYDGDVLLTDVVVRDNKVDCNWRGCTCGNVAAGIHNSGRLVMNEVQVENNDYSGIGTTGTLHMTTSVVQSHRGTGILNHGEAVVESSQVHGNSSRGITNWGQLTLRRSTITGNLLRAGDYTYQGGGGVATFRNSETYIEQTAITGNTVLAPGNPGAWGVSGGGIYAEGNTLIKHSTISANQVIGYCWWANPNPLTQGGGIFVNDSQVSLLGSTVSGNRVSVEHRDGCWDPQFRGSQFSAHGGHLTVRDATILSSSRHSSIGSAYRSPTGTIQNTVIGGSHEDLHNCEYSPWLTSLGNNLDRDGTCGLDHPTDIRDADPMLGPLQDNGGPTQTHAPLEGSPVIDSGWCDSGFDQRGVPRPLDGNRDGVWICDIGAVEYNPYTFKVIGPGGDEIVIPADGK